MNIKFLLSSTLMVMICFVTFSCKTTPINDSSLGSEGTTSSIDDSFLEGKWLCPKIITKSDSAGNIYRICIGAGAMNFDTKNKKVHLYDGCNYSSGDYTLWPDSVLTYTSGMWTEKYCVCEASPGGQGKIRLFVEDDTEGIELNNGVRKTLLLRPGRWFLSGDWEMDRLQNEEIDVSDFSVNFDLKKNLVTLCENEGISFTLPFSTFPNSRIIFNLSEMRDYSTKLNNTWRELFDLLNKTTSYEISAGGCQCTIKFYNNNHKFLFEIARIDDKIKEWLNKFSIE